MSKKNLKQPFWLFIVALAFATPIQAREAPFTIKSASLQKEQNSWFLQATIRYQLSDTAIEALNNGVPLTISVKSKLKKTSPWLWHKTVFHQEVAFQLRYLGLAKLYQITHLSRNRQLHFASFQAAIEYIGNLKEPLATAPFFEKGQRYFGMIKTALEIEALPLPLRPVAYLTPKWHLSSGWYEWSFTQ